MINFFVHINARKMVDMVSGKNYCVKRRQPVVKLLTVGVGTHPFKVDENGCLIESLNH